MPAKDRTVACPRVFVQLFEIFHNTGSKRIEVDIADQLQEIWIFFADNGFVPVLKEVAAALMAFIEGDRIARHDAAHEHAERDRAGAQEEVKMVWNERPCIALSLGLFENDCKSFKEGFAVFIISEDISLLDTPSHDVLEEARGI